MENKMKDSGIDFIGLIPNDWTLKNGKYLFNTTTGKLDANAEDEDGLYPFFTCASETKKINTSAFDCEALLIAGNGIVGMTQYYKGKFNAYQRTYVVTDFDEINPLFLKYYVSNLLPIKLMRDITGSVIPFIKLDDIRNFKICYPTNKVEQTLIAQYLDEKVPQIEKVIDVIKKEIEVLEMTKKSIITECVTKGLNSDVEMKDSGIKYLDKCPITWEIKRLKYLCKKITDGSHQSPTIVDFGKKYITVSDVYDNKINRNQAKEISEEDFKKLVNSGCQPQIGDVLLSKDGTVGRTAIVDNNDCVILSSLGILTPKTNILSKFLKYSLDSNFLQEQMLLSKMGSALQRITITKIKEYYGIIPPIEKQQEIVDYLDKKIDAINRIIDTKKEQISKLETHKQSLIYDYVTGKKRVKGVE